MSDARTTHLTYDFHWDGTLPWRPIRVGVLVACAVVGALLASHLAVNAQVLPGDVDGSGDVSAVDVQLVVLAALDLPVNYDCNIDGVPGVNALDVQFVINAALGLPVATPTSIQNYRYEIVHAYPHDPNAFTQGLVYLDGVLYEGTGLYGQSSLRKVELETGKVLQQRNLPLQYFGEGIAIPDNRIVQLTWQSHIGFVYMKDTFDPLGSFNYLSEGWGLTFDGVNLIMSDGTATLHFINPATFEEVRSVTVTDDVGPVMRLNELEFIQGRVYANVWQTDKIVIIDPDDGRVVGRIDLTGLLSAADRTGNEDVLNGIAYDAAGDRLFVTGKRWPKLFEIKLIPAT